MNKLNLLIKTISYTEAKDKIAWSDDEYTHYIVEHDNGKIEYRIDIDLWEYLIDYKKDKKTCEEACNESFHNDFFHNEYFIVHNQDTIIKFKTKYAHIFKNDLFEELYLIYKSMKANRKSHET